MKYGLNYFSDIFLTQVGLLTFFIWFVLMCVWVWKVIPQEQHRKMSMLPLENEELGHE